MANREKGELPFEIDGQTYTLKFNTEAMAQLEALFSTPVRDVTFKELIGPMLNGSIRHIRAFIWASLQHHHPGIDLKATSALMDRAGGIEGLATQMKALMQGAEPDPADLKALGVADRPRPPKAQTRRRR